MGDAGEDVRAEIGRLEGRIDLEVDDPAVRRALWQACDDAMAWSWQSAGKAYEQLVPVYNRLDSGPSGQAQT